MRRLILDTNLYIDWFNTGAHEPLLFQSDAVKMMSTVVMMELLAGAHAVRDRTRLHDLFRTFRKLGRLLVPSAEVYEDAGGILRQLQAVHGYRLRQAHSLTNDVLVALSARAVGGTVVTQIGRRFSLILAPFFHDNGGASPGNPARAVQHSTAFSNRLTRTRSPAGR